MVWIAGGEFAMGSDALGSRADEKPVVNVRVDGFWIDAHPVTNEEFRKFVAATGYKTTAENPSIGNKSNASSRADPSSAAPNTAKATARAPAADPPPTPA